MENRDYQAIKEENELKRQVEQLQVDSDFYAVLNTAEGKRFVKRIIAECGVFNASFNADPLVMAFNAGRRQIGLNLLAQFDGKTDLYIDFLNLEKQQND